ncbi:MAG: Cobalt-precorrin-5B C(1)-methyltransferase [Desulfovibrio sp.]
MSDQAENSRPEEPRPEEPREGFTTGSAVAAAAKAALTVLLGERVEGFVTIPLPPDENGSPRPGSLTIPVTEARLLPENAPSGSRIGTATVVKDGGTDPDATHRMAFIAEVSFAPFPPLTGNAPPLQLDETVTLSSGGGIGTATLPGLPVAVGELAVNPGPRRQIALALRETLAEYEAQNGPRNTPIHCRITAPEGEKRAKHTLNERLGIIGGISILGTGGTVKPFSSAAWQETIRQALEVAKATGNETIALTTGRRSEKALQNHLPYMPPQAFVQVADYAAFSVTEAAKRDFTAIAWACFPGKLLKLAQGEGWTHAKGSAPDFTLLETICRAVTVPNHVIKAAVLLPTVQGALELVRADSPKRHAAVMQLLAKQAAAALRGMIEPASPLSITLYAFDMQGRLLAKGYA